MTTNTAQFAARCVALSWRGLSHEARQRAKELVLDAIGVAYHGAQLPQSRTAARTLSARSHEGDATVIGMPDRLPIATAAMVNATAAHSTELDDVERYASLHPGVCVIPTALAVAEAHGSSGEAFLDGVVAGYEATLSIGRALGGSDAYRTGFHPTSVAGAIGAAVAAGRVCQLAEPEMRNAIGVASTMSSGSLDGISEGTWTKALNAGVAAHTGVVAMLLASGGYRGPLDLEDERGFLRRFSPSPRPMELSRISSDLAAVMQVAMKPYACCRFSHPAIDVLRELREKVPIDPDSIERIELGILSAGAFLVAEPSAEKQVVRSRSDAQFSAPFAAAVALLYGDAGPSEYSDEVINDPRVGALMTRVVCRTSDEMDRRFPEQFPGSAEIVCTDGRVLSHSVDFPRGEPERPLSTEEVRRKFQSITENLVPVARAREIADLVLSLERLDNMQRLGSLLAPVRV